MITTLCWYFAESFILNKQDRTSYGKSINNLHAVPMFFLINFNISFEALWTQYRTSHPTSFPSFGWSNKWNLCHKFERGTTFVASGIDKRHLYYSTGSPVHRSLTGSAGRKGLATGEINFNKLQRYYSFDIQSRNSFIWDYAVNINVRYLNR